MSKTQKHDSLVIEKYSAGIMCHHFHGDGIPKTQGSISYDEFKCIIEAIPRERIIDADEWLWRVKKNCLVGDEICFTFDDNLLCQYQIALGVLNEFGIKAFWFIYTSPLQGILERLEIYRVFRHLFYESMDQFYLSFFQATENHVGSEFYKDDVESWPQDEYLKTYDYLSINDRKFRYVRDNILTRHQYTSIMDELIESNGSCLEDLSKNLWMSSNEIMALSNDGHVIGLHTHTHPTNLASLDHKAQYRELSQNYEIIRDITGREVFAASYPNNSYNESTVEILQKLGILTSFRATADPKISSILEVPRHNHIHLYKKLFI